MSNALWHESKWEQLVLLRRVFDKVFIRESIATTPTLDNFSELSISAAEKGNFSRDLADFLSASAHNLHRSGQHKEGFRRFSRARQLYAGMGERSLATQAHYMMASCQRALGNSENAREILNSVENQPYEDDAWPGIPLQFKAWLAMDEHEYQNAVILFKKAITYHKKSSDCDILVAGVLADLGDCFSRLGRYDEALPYFSDSIELIRKHKSQYPRQEARTLLKMADALRIEGKYKDALSLLNQAENKIWGTTYDTLWKTEILRSIVYFNNKQYSIAIKKFRIGMHLYREQGQGYISFLKVIATRLRRR